MGLDAVEIVIAVEERFGISIEDSEAEKVRTPGMLTELVMQKVKLAGPDVCRTQRGFFLTRRFLIQNLRVARNEIGLNTQIADLIPEDRQAKVWTEFRDYLSATQWFPLEMPKRKATSVALFWFVGTCAFGAPLFIWLSRRTGSELSVLLVFFASVTFAVVLGKASARFRTLIPSRFQSVRDLSMLAASFLQEGKWLRSEVADAVKRIVIETLCIPEARFLEDADFVKDLGLE